MAWVGPLTHLTVSLLSAKGWSHLLRARIKMECLKMLHKALYNGIIGIKENNLRLSTKGSVLVLRTHTYFFFLLEKNHTCRTCHCTLGKAIRCGLQGRGREEHPLPTGPAALATEFTEIARLLLGVLFPRNEAIAPALPPLQGLFPGQPDSLLLNLWAWKSRTNKTACKRKARATV